MPRILFKVEKYRSELPPDLKHLFDTCWFVKWPTYILYQYISSFHGTIYQFVFSLVCAWWSSCLWRWNMTLLDTEMKELNRSTQHNTQNTWLLIHTLKYVPDIVADRRSIYGERVYTHTHTHTHTHLQSSLVVLLQFQCHEC